MVTHLDYYYGCIDMHVVGSEATINRTLLEFVEVTWGQTNVRYISYEI